ncbi:MAG: hypothetical protein OXI34_13720 [Chloroflexota bacterium]|nr:hypothetical protein [Chloroflexota bacterium]MDE2947982.1 hypothetical protein [Chloroflexota bacterium]
MADSLFDNRYRYDYIYPRGRSGETLRAVDTAADNRPVVIKRPNPNDAPPIRAGQEVSIINEREALKRLAGHTVLTELLGSGQFFVGGIPQQYIVMERAEGVIIADEVARLAGLHQRIPELEMLEILDRLVDLLRAAHELDIVYNDVDAKHLFWNRDRYELKVIDWGNAVFLEGDEATVGGISRQTDIYQIGELIYFILSGGYRIEVPRDADADFRVDFHQDAEAIDPRLQAIVTRAVHPNLRYRYTSLSELNADLLRYRSPLEQDRNTIVSRALDKLRTPDLNRNDLLALQGNLQIALRQNPAYPAARKAHTEIVDRLRDLEVAADLDAVQIYMRSQNWTSAADLLTELRGRAGSKTSGLVHLLLDWCLMLTDSQLTNLPASITDASALLFEYRADKAANTLLLGGADDPALRHLQARLAERVSSHFPDVLLLSPNLDRVESTIQELGAEGIPIEEASAILTETSRALEQDRLMAEPGASQLRDIYRGVVDSLSTLNANLQTLSLQHEFSERRLPLNALTRALNAAMALADNMHVVGKGAANNPRDALAALDGSRAIDPANPAWDKIEDFLGLLYEILQDCQTYVPAADGSDLEKWLAETKSQLHPFTGQLFDDMLADMLAGIETAQVAWNRYREVIVAGDKAEATGVLNRAAETVSTISPTLSSWFSQLSGVVEKANYVERHSVPGHLGRTLADGWAAFDAGQLADAQRLGQQAMEIARSDSEQFIAERLWRLSRALRDWVERNGVESESRTQQALLDVEDLFTELENRAINGFATQMPSTETYLKAMSQGLVQGFASTNTAALRILFAQYILSGVLDAHDGAIDDARFWQAACLRTLPETAERHIALRKLDEFIERRASLISAQNIFAELTGPHVSDSLAELIRQLESNSQSRLLTPGIQSLKALESALQDWADAEFRAAGNKIEQVLRSITEAESNANINLQAYRAWMQELQAALAELSVKRRNLLQEIDRQLDEPQPGIRDAIHLQADVTEDLLGYKHAQMMLGWRDTYEAFLAIYTGDKGRQQKLEAMDEFFKAMFIDRNPAYPLFRHWYRRVEAMPAEPPKAEERELDEPPATAPESAEHAQLPEATPLPEPEAKPAGLNRWIFNAALLIAVVLVIGGLVSLAGSGSLDDILAAILPDSAPTEAAAAPEDPSRPDEAEAAPDSDERDAAAAQTSDFQAAAEEAVSQDESAAAPTAIPQATAMPSEIPTVASTAAPTAILPPDGLKGAHNLLDLYANAASAPFWDESLFALQNGSWRLGLSGATDGETIFMPAPANLLDRSYGNAAPARIRRVEAEIALHSTDPGLAAADVYFGILLRDAAGESAAGIQIQQAGPDVISLALVHNGEADIISQRSVNNLITRLRLDRDPSSGAVSAFFNDSQIGDPIGFLAAGASVEPALFVKDGGVVIGVSAWEITLD